MTKHRILACCLGSIALAVAATISVQSAIGDAKKEQSSLVYELRTYTTFPGKLPALHARFRDHTMRIFKKHGIQNIIYWTPTDEKLKDNTLVYVIAHKSEAAASASWNAFRKDPDWQKAYKDSQKDGKIVMKVTKQYLAPTDYSPQQ